MSTVFYGAVVTPESLTSYLASPRTLFSVSKSNGEIEWLETDVPSSEVQEILAKHGVVDTADLDIVELKHGEFIMPGFVDTHTVSWKHSSCFSF